MRNAKRIAAVLLAAVTMIPAASCAKEGSTDSGANNAQNSKKDQEISIPVETDQKGGLKVDLTYQDQPENNQYPVTTPAVSAKRGEDGSLYVPQTDINGGKVTEEGGKEVTVAYTGTTLATSYAQPDYQPDYKTFFSMWVDTSRQKDYVFDGEFLVYEVKIKEDAKDGVYPIELYHTDFSNWAAKVMDVVTNVGYICINSEKPNPVHKNGGDIALCPDIITAKPGDTVQYVVKAENNTGIVGFRIWLSYDSNAMQFVRAKNGKDFESLTKTSGRDLESSQESKASEDTNSATE